MDTDRGTLLTPGRFGQLRRLVTADPRRTAPADHQTTRSPNVRPAPVPGLRPLLCSVKLAELAEGGFQIVVCARPGGSLKGVVRHLTYGAAVRDGARRFSLDGLTELNLTTVSGQRPITISRRA